MTERWVNRDAVEWVQYESGAAAEQRFRLLAVALHTKADGRGAFPAQTSVALLTGRSRRKTVHDLAELVKQGHLLPGDCRLVAHIRADHRPNVYDLPDKYRVWLSRGAGSAPHEGERRAGSAPRRRSRRARNDTNDVQSTTERRAAAAHKLFLKNSGKGERADAQPSAASDTSPETPTAPWPSRTKPTPEAEQILRNLGLRRRSEGDNQGSPG